MTRTAWIWLRALAALVLAAALTAGVPWLLVELIGNPYPADGVDWAAPVTDGAILGAVAVLAWVFWAQMVVCMVTEILSAARLRAGHSADRLEQLPATFGGQRQLARWLVSAIVAVSVGGGAAIVPALTTSSYAAVAAEPAAEVAAGRHTGLDRSRAPVPPGATSNLEGDLRAVTVSRGDSLWALAERHLGSGEAWRQIAELNAGRRMVDGERFVHAGGIRPGWQLLMPGTAVHLRRADADAAREPPDQRPDQVKVVQGDTLWGLAEQLYGNGRWWRDLHAANRDRIADPDLIYPGQILEVPAGEAPERRSANPLEPDRDPAPAGPTDGGPAASTVRPASPAPVPPDGMPSGSTAPRHGADHGAAAQSTPPNGPTVHAPPDRDEDGGISGLAVVLAGGGTLLAAGLLQRLAAHRRRQFRRRPSGRTVASTPAPLVEAERTVLTAGSAGADDAQFLDRALRDLANRVAHHPGATLPEVAAAVLGSDRLELILASPPSLAHAPAPWVAGESGLRWSIARTETPEPADAVAPYPTLVSVGVDDAGATWLLDLEAARVLNLAGDPVVCEELARFLAAELAVNDWSDDVAVTVSGFGAELVGLGPRLHHQARPPVEDLARSLRRADEASAASGHDVLTGRLDVRGADTWMARVLLVNPAAGPSPEIGAELDLLLKELDSRSGRTPMAAVVIGCDASRVAGYGRTQTVTADGRLTLQPWGVELTANRLNAAEAGGIVSLIAGADDAGDEPMPATGGSQPFKEVSDAAGALRSDLTSSRDDIQAAPQSLLPLPDEVYLARAATTRADLDALAPGVPSQVGQRVLALDPDLDADLAAWSDPGTVRPRVRLLGPVQVHAHGERDGEVERRPAYFTEVVAYLATREHGATPEQTSAAFGVQTNTIHSRVGTARRWLGTDPGTGDPYLPESTLSPAAKARGVPVYQLTGVLCDAELLKRLRVRAQARGAAGHEDLVAALSLVQGRPFDQLRPGGYGWLAETPCDHYLTAAVVDVAHLVATHALATGNLTLARWACETAITAAPSEDKPRLDLSAVLQAEGKTPEADQYLSDEVCNRSDDHAAPPDLTDRSNQVLSQLDSPHRTS